MAYVLLYIFRTEETRGGVGWWFGHGEVDEGEGEEEERGV